MPGRSRFDICRVCGTPLDQDAVGRKRKYCGDAHKQYAYRERKKWIKQANDAALAGEPEPPKWWLHPTFQKIRDEVLESVAKRRRSDADLELAGEVS